MFNPYATNNVKILKVYKDTNVVNRYTVQFKDPKIQKEFEFIPGQIIELSLLGYNEAPFAICSSAKKTDKFELTIRKAGRLTSAVHNLKVGDEFGIRGPFGNGFPLDVIKKKNLVIIAGGIGFIPFRSLLSTMYDDRKNYPNQVQVLYGSKTMDDLIFETEYKKWQKHFDMHITLDEGKKNQKIEGLTCDIGLITKLMSNVNMMVNSVAIICGPPVMCKFVINELKRLKFKDEDIYMSLERKMECGVGICEHCAVGSKFVCKDGPIFSWAEIKDIPGAV